MQSLYIPYYVRLIRFYYFISTEFKAVLGQYELLTDQNTRDHLAWTMRNGDPMHRVCIPYRIPRAYGNSKGEIRGRSRQQNYNSKRIVRNMDGRTVDTIRGKVPNKA